MQVARIPSIPNDVCEFSLVHNDTILAYDSVVTLAFAFVTLTPNCFALETISIRLRAETACAIL
jgi:hypothetical protein